MCGFKSSSLAIQISICNPRKSNMKFASKIQWPYRYRLGTLVPKGKTLERPEEHGSQCQVQT